MPSFKTKLAGQIVDGKSSPTGIEVPPKIIAALGSSKKPAVTVTIDGKLTYRSTVAVLGGKFMIPVSAERREAAGIKAGDAIVVDLEPDVAERTVEIPADLAAALAENKTAKAAFEDLAYSYRKEHARAVEDAKKPETRAARIAKIMVTLGNA
jgi:hypothetical protein